MKYTKDQKIRLIAKLESMKSGTIFRATNHNIFLHPNILKS